MSDAFSNRTRKPTDPAVSIAEIVPDDANDLDRASIALNVNTPGTLRVTMVDGTIGDLSIHPGHALPARVRRIWATGTTATGIRVLS